MFLIRLCFCIVCVDAVAIVFRIFHALRHDFPVRPLLVRLLGATIVAILLIILLTNYSKYEPICICNRIINNK